MDRLARGAAGVGSVAAGRGARLRGRRAARLAAGARRARRAVPRIGRRRSSPPRSSAATCCAAFCWIAPASRCASAISSLIDAGSACEHESIRTVADAVVRRRPRTGPGTPPHRRSRAWPAPRSPRRARTGSLGERALGRLDHEPEIGDVRELGAARHDRVVGERRAHRLEHVDGAELRQLARVVVEDAARRAAACAGPRCRACGSARRTRGRSAG